VAWPSFFVLPFIFSVLGTAQESASTIKVDVKLVNVFVTVTDEHDAPVGGLQSENFELKEDGQEQKIAVFQRESELPLSIVLAIDASLSVRKDLKLELLSARKFVGSVLRPIDALALYQFTESVNELVPFTSDPKKIDSGIGRVRVGAATALYDAIYLGSRSLLRRDGRKVIVVVTDGEDNMSQLRYQEALRSAQEAEAIVYSIVMVPIPASAGRNTGGEHALIQISRDTGGKHYYAAPGPELDRAFQQISEELRTQYLLAYYPSQKLSDHEFRTIHVSIRGVAGKPEFKVRHRAGYYGHTQEQTQR